MEIIIVVLVILLILSIWGNINLIKKLELYEDTVEFYQSYFNNIRTSFKKTLDAMRQIDKREAFAHDDEVGDIFKNLHSLVENLEKDVFVVENNES